MPYRALYRQWRPKTFSQMVGQTTILDTLRNQVMSDRIAHAYLFCGSRGTGKTSTAKILAKAINCEHPVQGDPCGECPSCLRQENEESLDIIEIDAASNNGVDEMRDLRDTVKYPPQFGKYKVYIIDEVHMLSTSAFNALLKTLEEPPAHVVFILATTEPQKLPETILSRCQRFDFGRIGVSDIQARLREAADGAGAEATNGALMLIARAAEGGMRDALSILDMCLGTGRTVDEALVREVLGANSRDFLFSFADAMQREDIAEALGMIDELMRQGRDPAVFAREFSGHIRSLLVAKCCPQEISAVLDGTEEDQRDWVRQAESFTVTRLMKILDLFMSLETDMRYAASPRLALENTALKACLRTGETDARALLDRIEELEKTVAGLGGQADAGPVADRIGQLEQSVARLSERVAAGAGMEPKAQRLRAGGTKATSALSPDLASAKGSAGPEKAAASKAAAIGDKDPAKVWQELITLLKKQEPAVPGMLALGKFVGVENGVYVWETGRGIFMVNSLNTRKTKLGEYLTEITGVPCAFEAREEGTSAPAQEDGGELAYLQSLYDTFGQEPVDVVDQFP